MERTKFIESIQTILSQVNQCLDPEDRLLEAEIARLCADLDDLLRAAVQGPTGPKQIEHQPQATVWERLAALWAAFKEELATWLGSMTPKWRRLLHTLMQVLRQLEAQPGAKTLLAAVLVVVIVAVVATLAGSQPLLVALLATLGLATLVQVLESRPIVVDAPVPASA